MAKNKALSLRVQWLGERLRSAREAAGYTLEEAGDYLQVRHTTLSRFENGIHRAKPSYIRDLVDFYGISNERDRAALLQLNEDAWRKDMWIGSTEGLDVSFIDYSWLEARATRMAVYEPLIINGLLQTAAYAEALTRDGLGARATPDAIARTIEVRTARQTIFNRDTPTALDIVFEETALRRRIGDTAIYAEQLRHLLKVATSNVINIRVLDPSHGWHPGLHGPFTLIELPDPYPDVAYTENLVGRAFLEDEVTVDTYRAAYNGLRDAARDCDDSIEFIRTLAKEAE